MIAMEATFLRGSYPPLVTPFRDGAVDLEDLAIIKSNYGMTSRALFTDGDVNRNGSIGRDDVVALLSAFGDGGTPLFAASAQTQAVPEPNTLSLILLAATCAGVWGMANRQKRLGRSISRSYDA